MKALRGLGYAVEGAQKGFSRGLTSILMAQMLREMKGKADDKKKAEAQQQSANASANEFDQMANAQPDSSQPNPAGSDSPVEDLAAQEASFGNDGFDPYTSQMPTTSGIDVGIPEMMADGGSPRRRGLVYAADGIAAEVPQAAPEAAPQGTPQAAPQAAPEKIDNPFVAYVQKDEQGATDFFERMNSPDQRSKFLMGMAMVNFAATEGKEGLNPMMSALNHIEQFRKAGGIKALALADSGDYQGAMKSLQDSGMYKGIKGMRPVDVVVGKNPYNGEEIKRRVYDLQTEGGVLRVDPVNVASTIGGATTLLDSYQRKYFTDPMAFAQAQFQVERSNRGLGLQEEQLKETQRNHGLAVQRYDADREERARQHNERLEEMRLNRAAAASRDRRADDDSRYVREAREDQMTKDRLLFIWGADKAPKELKPDEMMTLNKDQRAAYDKSVNESKARVELARRSFSLFDYNRGLGNRISPQNASEAMKLAIKNQIDGTDVGDDIEANIRGTKIRIPKAMLTKIGD